MSNAVTEAQIEAYRRAKQIAHGCIYGCYNKYENRHYIVDRSHEVWSMCSDDYEAGHAAMTAEVDRLRDSAALSAVLSVNAKPEPIGYGVWINGKLSGCAKSHRDSFPLYAAPAHPPAQAEPVAEVLWYDPSMFLQAMTPRKIIDASMEFMDQAPIGTKLYAHPPAPTDHMDGLARNPRESEADYIARLLRAAGAKADRGESEIERYGDRRLPKRLDDALCQFLNCVGDNPGDPEQWAEETDVNYRELCEAYNEAHESITQANPPAPAPVKPLELLDPADDEAMDWITSNLMAIRRDNGSMEYGLTAVVRAFQAGAKTTAVVIKEAAYIVENFPSNDGVRINRFDAATAVRHLLSSIYTSPEQGETDV